MQRVEGRHSSVRGFKTRAGHGLVPRRSETCCELAVHWALLVASALHQHLLSKPFYCCRDLASRHMPIFPYGSTAEPVSGSFRIPRQVENFTCKHTSGESTSYRGASCWSVEADVFRVFGALRAAREYAKLRHPTTVCSRSVFEPSDAPRTSDTGRVYAYSSQDISRPTRRTPRASAAVANAGTYFSLHVGQSIKQLQLWVLRDAEFPAAVQCCVDEPDTY